MTTPTSEQIEELKQIGPATLHEVQGQRGAMASQIKPLVSTFRVAGPALTVDTFPRDNLMLHHALSIARPGDVLVVDAKGFTEGGPWGDVMTLAAQLAGVAGLVIDGSVRDSAAIVEMGFPVFSRAVSIKGTAKNQPGKVGAPIVCGGATVRPGDIVVGDADGVVVVAAEEVTEVLARARDRLKKEDHYRALLRGGQTTVDFLGLRPVLDRMGLK